MRKLIANHSGLLQRINGIERKQLEADQKFEQVFKALESKDQIPTQGVFFDGQVFDAYALTTSTQLRLDVQKANAQYGNFELKTFAQSHDRFLIIDQTEVYHLGASLKDLGKKWFAFSKMDKNSVSTILNSILELI
jgi:hypothetical protein